MKRIMTILIMTLLFTLAMASLGSASREIMTLLTEEEGAKADALPGSYIISRGFNDGPKVKVVSPKVDEKYKPPLKVIVTFIPRDNHPVDLSSLKVECLKFISIDLTPRVLPYATKEGINIENAKLPSGNHTLRLTIRDVAGGTTQEIFKIRVL